ncbi:MAG: CAP domain-containing protein [bacterium]|nr:CAP domain-containing protein [bacterium]
MRERFRKIATEVRRGSAAAVLIVSSFLPGAQAAESEPSINGCAREDLDTVNFSPGHLVCIKTWEINGSVYEAPGVDMGEMDETSYGFLVGVNKIRLEEGLSMVRSSRYLDSVAKIRIKQMAGEGIFSHYELGCDARFGECVSVRRLLGEGATEILGRANAPKDKGVDLIMPAFKKSPSHFSAIVRPDTQSAGVAWEVASDEFFYVAVVFDNRFRP